jgi:hypothetical protein
MTYNEQTGHVRDVLHQYFPRSMPKSTVESSIDIIDSLLGPGWKKLSVKRDLPLPGLVAVLIVYEPGQEYYAFSFMADGPNLELIHTEGRVVF